MFRLLDHFPGNATRESSALCGLPASKCRPNDLVALVGFITCSVVLAGCVTGAAASVDPRYPEIYRQKVDQHHSGQALPPDPHSKSAAAKGLSPGIPSDSENQQLLRQQFEYFIDLFSNLQPENLETRIQRAYGENVYFNDTLQTHTSRETLTEYLVETANSIDYSHVSVHRIIPAGEDYFLQWSMKIGFRALGKTVKAESIGMTHIRFDSRGKVVFHQDFWDNTEGLFRHIPVVGYFIRKTHDRL